MAGELKRLDEALRDAGEDELAPRRMVHDLRISLDLLKRAEEFVGFAGDHSGTVYGKKYSRKWLQEYKAAKGE
jgi:hypothetical protein